MAVGFWVSVNSSANHPKAPEGLAFWVVAMVVIAGGLTGLVGGLLAKMGNSKKPPPSRNAPPEGGVARPPRHAHNGARSTS